MGRKFLTADERHVQRILCDRFWSLERELMVMRREIEWGQLAHDVRHLILPMPSACVLQATGAVNTTTRITPGGVIYFQTAGTTTITVTKRLAVTWTAIAAGGGGCGANAVSSDQNGGGGGGGACSTTGTPVTHIPGVAYALVVPASTPSATDGNRLTLTNGGTLINLDGGHKGEDTPGGAGGSTGASSGSNLHAGGAGGTGVTESSHPSGSDGSAGANSAGGGGGGNAADSLEAVLYNGGAGKDEAGQLASGTYGGRGGGFDINGTKYGWGGGGAHNDNTNDIPGQAGAQGAAKLAA